MPSVLLIIDKFMLVNRFSHYTEAIWQSELQLKEIPNCV